MKLKPYIVLLIGLLLLAQATGPVAHAQEPEGGAKKGAVDIAAGAGVSAGIGNAPPAGYTVLYMFSGVANETGGGRDEVTVVHCTNYHPSAAVDVRVQIFPLNASPTYEATLTIASGATRTFGTQHNAALPEDVLLAPTVPDIFQGSGRVLVKQHSQVICTVHVLDADADPPVYAVRLALLERYGRIARHVRNTFLPLIQKK